MAHRARHTPKKRLTSKYSSAWHDLETIQEEAGGEPGPAQKVGEESAEQMVADIIRQVDECLDKLRRGWREMNPQEGRYVYEPEGQATRNKQRAGKKSELRDVRVPKRRAGEK